MMHGCIKMERERLILSTGTDGSGVTNDHSNIPGREIAPATVFLYVR